MSADVAARFPELFGPSHVAYADADIVGTTEEPPAALVHRVHVVARPAPGLVTVCESTQGWRFLPGGRLAPGEDVDQAVRRELTEEAGAVPDGPVRFFFSHVATSRQPRPYLPHVPHPVTWWSYAVCRSRVLGAPTAPEDAEQITAVHHLPAAEALAWLAGDDTDPTHAHVLRLAVHLGLV